MATAWTKLTHAYGKAKDVPAMLDALRSADADVRAKARRDLEAALAHQGNLFAATAPAVAAIRAMLAEDVPDKAALIGTFVTLFLGDPERFWHTGYPPSPDAFEPKAAKPWREAYAEAEQAADVLVTLLEDSDAAVRGSAAHALAWLGTRARAVSAKVAAALAGELDPGAKRSLVLANGWLGGKVPIDGTAAGAIARAHQATILLPDLALLEATVASGETAAGWGPLAPIAFAHLDAYLGSHQEEVVATWLRIAEGDGAHAEAAKRPAFAFIFGMGRKARPSALAPDQQRLLRVFVSPEAPDPKVLEALYEAGMPPQLAALRALAGLPPSRWERTFTIGGRTSPAREFSALAPIDIAELSTDDAIELACLWASAEAKRPDAVRALLQTIVLRPDADAALARAAAAIVSDGPPRETRAIGMVVHMSIPQALVEAGDLLGQRGLTVGTWHEQMKAMGKRPKA